MGSLAVYATDLWILAIFLLIIAGIIELIIKRRKQNRRNLIFSRRLLVIKIVFVFFVLPIFMFFLAFVLFPIVSPISDRIHSEEQKNAVLEEVIHLPYIMPLPTEAKDINYSSLSYWMTLADFAISEEDFRKWCSYKDWPLSDVVWRVYYGSVLDVQKREVKNPVLPHGAFKKNSVPTDLEISPHGYDSVYIF